MGMYDTVHFNCVCGGKIETQSKAGKNLLRNFGETSVPNEIAADIVGDVVVCPSCDSSYTIQTASPLRSRLYLSNCTGNEDDDTTFD